MASSVQAAAAKLDSSPHKVVMMMLESPANETNKAFAKLVEEAYKRMGKDLYLALRVSPTATPQEIKKNYRTLSLLYHPDKSRADTSELFQCLSKAYEVSVPSLSSLSLSLSTAKQSHSNSFFSPHLQTLSDETERSKYDRKAFGSRKPGSEYNKENTAPRQQNRKEASSAPSSQSRTAGDRGKLRPAAPYLLRCSHVDHESVTLFWKVRPSDEAVTFELQTRLVNEVGWPKSASGIRNSACRKKNLTPHTAYHFRVRAIDGSGSASAWSVPVTVATTKEPVRTSLLRVSREGSTTSRAPSFLRFVLCLFSSYRPRRVVVTKSHRRRRSIHRSSRTIVRAELRALLIRPPRRCPPLRRLRRHGQARRPRRHHPRSQACLPGPSHRQPSLATSPRRVLRRVTSQSRRRLRCHL